MSTFCAALYCDRNAHCGTTKCSGYKHLRRLYRDVPRSPPIYRTCAHAPARRSVIAHNVLCRGTSRHKAVQSGFRGVLDYLPFHHADPFGGGAWSSWCAARGLRKKLSEGSDGQRTNRISNNQEAQMAAENIRKSPHFKGSAGAARHSCHVGTRTRTVAPGPDIRRRSATDTYTAPMLIRGDVACRHATVNRRTHPW